MIDTLSTAMSQFEEQVDQMGSDLQKMGQNIFKELVDPLTMYLKHYQNANSALLTESEQVWTALHTERTMMLFAKEEYFNEVSYLRQLQR